VDRLRLEKHFINVLFRLLGAVSTARWSLVDTRGSALNRERE
jgi:hypothetical protein